MPLELLQDFCREKGMPLLPDQVLAFEQYAEALYSLNAVMNLTRVPREDCELRHLVDSLLVAEFVPQGSRVLDIGTGPGFPAWPLACARPDLQVVGMDSSGKMLRALSAVPLTNLRVRQHRSEDVDEPESFDVATGRAVAPLGVQLELSVAWLRTGGRVVPFRTPNEKLNDFKNLGLELESTNERSLPGTTVVRVFPVYRKVKKTPNGIPRSWAEIKNRPF